MLKFDRVETGARLFLDDGSSWRVGLNYIRMAQNWLQGEQIEVYEDRTLGLTHPFRLTNRATGETINVIKMASMPHWP